jgi:hypothetical protein
MVVSKLQVIATSQTVDRSTFVRGGDLGRPIPFSDSRKGIT